MQQQTPAPAPATQTQTKVAKHSPCALAVAACRLAAIAAIAEPAQLVARAYAAEASRQAGIAEDTAADDPKDMMRQIATAHRWVLAAEAAAESRLR